MTQKYNLISELHDINGDGKPDYKVTYTYDKKGNLLSNISDMQGKRTGQTHLNLVQVY
ncbi:MAG: hypothetical protein KME32_36190 [Mojavia pulchra JT2-VF2]|uniref:Uncharacterized protein n=1 Tax=Mojavia pulchra JT2-VF2 TaxID=287848 RepID=A0A951Q5Z1_9NOST|nr:hypothetical protein [Mojavia pulchra JT2-VF2]